MAVQHLSSCWSIPGSATCQCMHGQQPGACSTLQMPLQGSRPASRESSLPGHGGGSSPGSRPGTSERFLRAVLRDSPSRASPARTAPWSASASVTSPGARRQGVLLNEGSLPSFGRRSPGSAVRAARPHSALSPGMQPRPMAGRRLLLPALPHQSIRMSVAALPGGMSVFTKVSVMRCKVPQTIVSCR